MMRMEILKLVGGVASLVQHPCLTEFGKLADEVPIRQENAIWFVHFFAV